MNHSEVLPISRLPQLLGLILSSSGVCVSIQGALTYLCMPYGGYAEDLFNKLIRLMYETFKVCLCTALRVRIS
ncbi:hypothetical protein BDV59DRAFT_168677 [Aspergillus ambiguus]|uniref:uncharacterized protein n=1 Tax=Aspergillus ambiguus TaxID=176160 RepID=UPI003CCD5FAF